MKNLEDLAVVTGGFIEGAIRRIQQLREEKKKNAERDGDLPSIPGGSLGSFKNGLQSVPLKVFLKLFLQSSVFFDRKKILCA